MTDQGYFASLDAVVAGLALLRLAGRALPFRPKALRLRSLRIPSSISFRASLRASLFSRRLARTASRRFALRDAPSAGTVVVMPLTCKGA